MKLRTIALGCAAALTFSAASAIEPQGWYLGLGAGWSATDPVRFNLAPPAGPATGKLDLGDTAAVDFDLGYKFAIPMRAELEVKYADFGADLLRRDGGPNTALSGDAGATSFLANLLYDIPLTRRFALTLGAGVGAAMFDPSIGDGLGDHLTGAGTEFSWQAIGGLTLALNDRMELQADYRYQSIDVTGHDYNSPVTSQLILKNKNIQSAMLTLRWYVDAPAQALPSPPPPPSLPPLSPPPLPLPPPVTSFLVFFDFDKADITPQAQQIVAEAAKAAKENGFVKIQVTGNTDTVGSASYNQALSEKRAASVKAELITDGLDDGDISTVGKGFSDPLVPTAPGVREPRNRRAVIDLGK